MTNVFIDGSAGTTGLQIRQRLGCRSDLNLLTLPEALRKDLNARKDIMNQADVVFLCLPDDAAREAVTLVSNPETTVIDTSTAHRVSPQWVYGFPELHLQKPGANPKRIANPGCHATGFISLVYPLTACGLLPKDAALSCFSLTGYSGGGKKMIAAYEADDQPDALLSGGIYALPQQHKHLPEMVQICGLSKEPVFCPVVEHYYKGMATTVTLHAEQLSGGSVEKLQQAYADFYHGASLIQLAGEVSVSLYGNAMAGRDSLQVVVSGNDSRMTVTALFDNLGKGASGAAIENMNLLLGLEPTTGLVL